MNKEAVDKKKESLIDYVGKVGIQRDEVETYFGKEYRVSSEMGMTDEDSLTRALISTVNYYRKCLDKMGNRITFLCLGLTQPTDYGLGQKVKMIRKKYVSIETSDVERAEMREKGIVSIRGTPLHTADTTFIESKIGTPIEVADEYIQTLIGVVETDGKIFPALVKVYGKKECDVPKIMYTWCSISADQSQTQKPGYILLNARDLGMKPLAERPNRISLHEYKSIVEKEFASIIYDVSIPDDMNRLDALILAQGHGKVGHVFLRNARMSTYSAFPGLDVTTELTSVKNSDEIRAADIVADMKIPSVVPLDVDEATVEELWLCVLPREKQPGRRMRFDALGMYVQTPIKKDDYKISNEFMKQDKEITTDQTMNTSRENEAFFSAVFPNR